MKHIRLFKITSEFDGIKSTLETPWVAVTEDDMQVHIPMPIKAETVWYYSDGTSYEEDVVGTLDATTGHRGDGIHSSSEITKVKIGTHVTNIGIDAFLFGSLTEVVIPDSVTSIDSYAFSKCNSLKSVTIPDSVTSIGGGAFDGCSGLTSVIIGSGVTDYSSNMFAYCYNVEYLSFNSKEINDNYTMNMRSLATVELGNNVSTIGYCAFQGKSELKSIIIPFSVTTIGNQAFQQSGIESIIIPNSVTSIGDRAFQFCDSLTSITIPVTVTSIGSSALESCNNIEILNYNARTPISSSFLSMTNSKLKVVNIGDYVPSISSFAFVDRRNLEKVTIGTYVTSIDTNAFTACTNLETINYNGTVEQWNAITKDANWHNGVPATTVTCTDGTAPLD